MSNQASENSYDFKGLKALVFNCTLKKGPETSNTDGLISVATRIMQKQGVATEVIRAIDHTIAIGVYPDMREHGWQADEWPELFEKVKAADIVILAGPIWLGDNSSVMKQVIERLYAHSSDFNDKGQYIFYGKVGGSIITGNEDGGKHCSMNILYSLQHIGFTVPPNADVYWVGPAGPGPSYLEEGSGGPQSEFTNRNATFMAWNLMHMAHLLKSAGGIPAYGTSRKAWDAGTRFNFENPEYR